MINWDSPWEEDRLHEAEWQARADMVIRRLIDSGYVGKEGHWLTLDLVREALRLWDEDLFQDEPDMVAKEEYGTGARAAWRALMHDADGPGCASEHATGGRLDRAFIFRLLETREWMLTTMVFADVPEDASWDDLDKLISRPRRQADPGSELERLTSRLECTTDPGLLETIYFNRAAVLRRMSKHDLAVGELQKAREIHRAVRGIDDPIYFERLARVYLEMDATSGEGGKSIAYAEAAATEIAECVTCVEQWVSLPRTGIFGDYVYSGQGPDLQKPRDILKLNLQDAIEIVKQLEKRLGPEHALLVKIKAAILRGRTVVEQHWREEESRPRKGTGAIFPAATSS